MSDSIIQQYPLGLQTKRYDSVIRERVIMSFGKWLKETRTGKRMSGVELEKLSGISRQYISNLETGQKTAKSNKPIQPSEEAVEKLARALQAPIDEARLAAGYAPKSNRRSRVKNIVEFLEALEALGIEFGPGLLGDKRLEDFTADDFEDLLARVKRDVLGDIEIVFRKMEK